MRTRGRYPSQFRDRAIALASDGPDPRPIAEVARELGVSATTLRRWLRANAREAAELAPLPTQARSPGASSAAVRRRMSEQRTRDTLPEMALRRELHRRGLRYRVSVRPIADLRRTADIVFRRARVAVFVDGCFWHRCPEHGSESATNTGWWQTKLEANVARDRDTDSRLAAAGWTVIRVWEHEPPESAADRVLDALRR